MNIEDQLKTLNSSSTSRENILRAELDEMDAICKELKAENNALRNNSYNTRIALLKAENQELRAENVKLKADLGQARSAFDLKSIVHECCDDAQEFRVERERLINTCVALESQIAGDDTELAENDGRCTEEESGENIWRFIGESFDREIHPDGVPRR